MSGMEKEIERAWERTVREGRPCRQGLCGREGCPTCERQRVLWEQFWETMKERRDNEHRY